MKDLPVFTGNIGGLEEFTGEKYESLTPMKLPPPLKGTGSSKENADEHISNSARDIGGDAVVQAHYIAYPKELVKSGLKYDGIWYEVYGFPVKIRKLTPQEEMHGS